jgi:3-oxoacyl-[acyl-carrier protein] reductase
MENGDAGDYEFIADFVSHVVDRFGENIDLLVNNAGISYVGLLTDMDINDWNHIINTNTTSVFNSCRHVVPYMVKQQSGHIINISSVWGNVGASCEVAYSASKGAINSFTKALAKELAPSHISVNAIAFGAIDTDMNSHLSEEEKASLEYEIPYGRMATPEEAARFILHTADAGDYLTGQILTFDGAWQ